MSAALERLAGRAHPYVDPLTAIDWQAADDALPWLPPDLLSLAGLEEQAAMSRADLLRFSRIEFARLCAAGLWLEGLLINRITSRDFPGQGLDEARVMLREVRDECGHGLMFLEMISRAGLGEVSLLGAKRVLNLVARRLSPNSAEFWSLVFIGESVTDSFATKALRAASAPGREICPVARQVLMLHHRDEAPHIAAARSLLEARIGVMSTPRKWLFRRAMGHLLPHFLNATLYPTAASLAALGLPEPERTAREARKDPRRRRLAMACTAPALDVLARHGLSPLPREGGGRYGKATEAAP